jgi:diacylglycerol kinase family enzyme
MFPYAEDREGRMQLRASTISSVDFVKHFPKIWRGEHVDAEKLFDYLVDDVEIEMDPATNFQVGGDVVGERRTARVRLTEPVPVVDFYAPPRG